MNFFRHFPFVRVTANTKPVILQDITRRVGVRQEVFREGTSFFKRILSQDDRMDTVSQKVYGQPIYAWAVAFLNRVINPFTDWKMSDRAFEKYLNHKYPSGTSALCLYPNQITLNLTSSTITGTFSANQILLQANTNANATIIAYNASSKLLHINAANGVFSTLHAINTATGTSTNITSITPQENFRIGDTINEVHTITGWNPDFSILYVSNSYPSLFTANSTIRSNSNTFGLISFVTNAADSPTYFYNASNVFVATPRDSATDYITMAQQEYALNEQKRVLNILSPNYIALAQKELQEKIR